MRGLITSNVMTIQKRRERHYYEGVKEVTE